MLVLSGRSEVNTQKRTLALRWEALLFSTLCLLESSSETDSAFLDTYPCLLLGIDSKAVETIGYWLPGDFGSSNLPSGQKLVFVCQFSLPESIHWQELSDLLSAFSKQTQEQKSKVEWLCHEPYFAISEGGLGYLPGNFEIGFPSSVQFSCSVMSDSSRPRGPQHARPPCPSPTPGVYPNSCPLSQWCHPTVSSSVIPFSSCPQSFPASGSFQMSQLFASGGQSNGVSASTSVLPVNTQDWSLGWTGWISLLSKGLSRVFSTPQFKSIHSSALGFLYSPTLTSIHDHWKNHNLN